MYSKYDKIRVYPEFAISIINGTHEELYDRLRFGEVDLVLNDQRRAFSDEKERANCYIEEFAGILHELLDRQGVC